MKIYGVDDPITDDQRIDPEDEEQRQSLACGPLRYEMPYYWGADVYVYRNDYIVNTLTRYEMSNGKGFRHPAVVVRAQHHSSELRAQLAWAQAWRPTFPDLCGQLGLATPAPVRDARAERIHPLYSKAQQLAWKVWRENLIYIPRLYRNDRSVSIALDIAGNPLSSRYIYADDLRSSVHLQRFPGDQAAELYTLLSKGLFDEARMVLAL